MRRVVGIAFLVTACSSSSSGGGGGTSSTSTEPTAPVSGGADGPRLTVAVNGTGAVRSDPPGIACGGASGACSATFPSGTVVTLTAAPAEGWSFTAFGDACAGHACGVTLDADVAVSAAFAQIDPRWDPSVGATDCQDAWGTAGEELSPCDAQKDHYVVVHKSKRNVAQCDSGLLVCPGEPPLGSETEHLGACCTHRVFFVESATRAAPRQFQRLMRAGDLRTRGSPKFVTATEWRPIR